jgi:hypothetical protein
MSTFIVTLCVIGIVLLIGSCFVIRDVINKLKSELDYRKGVIKNVRKTNKRLCKEIKQLKTLTSLHT